MKKVISVRNVTIGDGSVSVQSMTNLPVIDVAATLNQIQRLRSAGCDIVRIAVPDKHAIDAFAEVRRHTDMPLVADIHFDYRLAVAVADCGADKIRINPGNIGENHLPEVVAACRANGIPIRIGVNGGSINKHTYAFFCDKATAFPDEIPQLDPTFDLLQNAKVLALADSVKSYVDMFDKLGFNDIVLSVKSSNVRETVAANKLLAPLGYPLHLGVTEAGLARQGLVKNAAGIGALLLQGIGDTIRVSLTADPVDEVYAARDLLVSLGLRRGVTFVSCPKCGRCTVDLQGVAEQVYAHVAALDSDIKVAVMGCEVNGPGECSDADIGMAGAKGGFVFFKQGKVYKRVSADVAVAEFTKEVDEIVAKNR